MAHGLDPDKELVLRWNWLPERPLPLDQRLPVLAYRDDAAFRPTTSTFDPQDPELLGAYRFNFSTLAKQSPDLRLYRLVQLFNTPLFSMTTRDAGRSSFAYWHGKSPEMPGDHQHAHFWFFRDGRDQDLVVLEYGFDQGLVLRSESKSRDVMRRLYDEICIRVNERNPTQ